MAESPPPSPPVDGGSLLLQPAGGVIVATDELFGYTAALSTLASDLRIEAANLARLARAGWSPLAGRPCVGELEAARRRIAEAASAATELERSVREAAENYAIAEALAERRQQAVVAALAACSGPALWSLAIMALALAPTLAGTAAFGWILGRVTGTDPIAALRDLTLGDRRRLTDPATVRAIELGVVSSDDLAAGALGVPAGVTALLGDEGLGLLGADTTAVGALAAAGTFGMLRESPVRIDSTRIGTGGAAPAGAEERLARIPEGDQIRIEKYEADGVPPRWLVYVGPTEDFSPVATDEPWDLTSNVAGVAGLSAGSLRAVELAMGEAGIDPGDEVQFAGYSQGGLVAARLAESGVWNTTGIVTFGAPIGTVDLPPDLPGLTVRNTDDLVPALAGPSPVSGQLQAERRAYPEGVPIPSDEPLPAHQRSAYAETARLIDQASSPEARSTIARLDSFAGDYAKLPGATVTVSTFHAERVATSGER